MEPSKTHCFAVADMSISSLVPPFPLLSDSGGRQSVTSPQKSLVWSLFLIYWGEETSGDRYY